jgi:hypothetical protein
MSWYWFGHKAVKVYYQFNSRKDIGPTGDWIDPGTYWTIEYFSAMAIQADNVYIETDDGLIEMVAPRQDELATDAEVTWLKLTAEPLRWAGVK